MTIEAHPEEFVTIASHHTLEVSPHYIITIEKPQWKKHHLDRLNEAVKASKRPRVVIVAMDDEDASIAVLREYGLDKASTIKSERSGKQFESKRDTTGEYFVELAKTLSNYEVDKFIVAGPGFVKNNFQKFCNEKYPELAKRMFIDDTGSAGGSGIQEVLKRGAVEKIAGEQRVAMETKLVERLLVEIGKGNLSTYGLSNVKAALDYGAVETLLVLDSLFAKKRAEIEPLLTEAEQTSSDVRIISSEHDAGKQLKALGGIAAILRFKIE
jgi:protein pelota